jgi:hypothetical protein
MDGSTVVTIAVAMSDSSIIDASMVGAPTAVMVVGSRHGRHHATNSGRAAHAGPETCFCAAAARRTWGRRFLASTPSLGH